MLNVFLKKDNHFKFIIFIITIFSIYSLQNMLKVNYRDFVLTNSVFSLILFLAIYYLYLKTFSIENKKYLKISIIIGFLFSLFMDVGSNVYMYDTTFINLPVVWIRIIFGGTPFFTAIIINLYKFINQVTKNNHLPVLTIKLNKLNFLFIKTRKTFLLIWSIIFISWLPALYASYPGVLGYDTYLQYPSYTKHMINNHHPYIHTLLYGFFADEIGKKLLNNVDLGSLLYSIFQMLILSFAMASIYRFLQKKNCSNSILLLNLLFFMFFPPYVIMSFSMTKDVIYTSFFVLMIICTFELCDDPEIIHNRKFFIKFIIVCIFQILFRSQGIYIFLFLMVILFLKFKGIRFQTFAVFCSCIILYAGYLGPLANYFHVNKIENLQEMMSVPCVQLSRSIINDNGELSLKEKELIIEYIPDYKDYTIYEGIGDAVKNDFNTEKFRNNPKEFIKLWITVGLKKPLEYINAFTRLTIGYWYPDMNYRDPKAYHPYWEYWTTQKPNFISKFFMMLSSNGMKEPNKYQIIPVVSMLFSSGMVLWIIILFLGWCALNKNIYFIPSLVSLFAIFILLLGPVVLYRYIFPIMLSNHIYLSLFTINEKEKNNITEKIIKIQK